MITPRAARRANPPLDALTECPRGPHARAFLQTQDSAIVGALFLAAVGRLRMLCEVEQPLSATRGTRGAYVLQALQRLSASRRLTR